jgi:putative ABC transport system permease protein
MSFLWLRTWQLGIKNLRLHKLRSALTVLGIFIGVASVIWLLAIGEGISQKAQEQIESLGANNIIIRSIKPPVESNDSSTSGHSVVPYGITRDDYDRLVQTIDTIERALPIREIRYRFANGGRLVEGTLVGCTPEYAQVNKLEIDGDRGHFLTDAEVSERQNHCVLAAGVADKLFPFEYPVGQAIHLEEAFYVVVGVLKPRTPTAGIGGSFAAKDYNFDVYIPISTLQSRIGDFVMIRRPGLHEGEYVELSQITLRVDKVEHVMDTAELVKRTMARYHHKDDYGVVVPLELLEQAKTTRMMFIIFMGLIAAISLVVGGIGIMNIMLATVTERTREIGIRRALGAKRGDITRQFLAETVVLSIAGGITGVSGGFACRPVIGWLRGLLERAVPNVMSQLPEVIKTVNPVIVPWSIPLAFGISVAIGVIFGLYPAIRAARMDPIEALRHE